MSRLLIIPDLHGRKFWRKAVANNIGQVDKVIFLGDYLDPYGDEIEDNPKLMECKGFGDSKNLLSMLNDIISLKKNDPNKYILLTGNHTDSYIWSKFKAATRTDYKNWELYHKFFSQNLEYFNLVWIENDVIFSHAGISEGWAKKVWEALEYSESEYKSIMDSALVLNDIPLSKFDNKLIKLISDISYYRYGEAQFGSCEWADIREHINFKESTNENIISNVKEDVFQIFGHSQVKVPLKSNNWICLDCRKGFIFDTITHEIDEG